MLPFLKKNLSHSAGVIVEHRKPDSEDMGGESDDKDAPLKAAARDLLSAISEQDIHKLAAAFRAAFEILESEPHDEAME